jgi:acyl-CoA synthetase (AMP-forming)/AMP-acid ligase II
MDSREIDVVTGVRRWSAATHDRTAFIFLNSRLEEAETLTFGALDARARALAAVLEDRTVPGERALLVHPPGVEFVIALFGCFYAGVVAVPVPPPRTANRNRQTLDRLINVAADCRPSLILTVAALSDVLASIAPDMPCLATDTVPPTLACGWSERAPAADELALLQYTSGSTGVPKGVKVSHANLSANLIAMHHIAGHDRNAPVVSWLPQYHDMGLLGTTIYPLVLGATCCAMAPSTFLQRPIRWLQAISRYGATLSGGPNFAYEHCVRRITREERAGLDLSSLEVAFNGAEPVRMGTLENFAEAFAPHGFRRSAFLPCYGLAESTLIVAGARRDEKPTVRMADPMGIAAGMIRATDRGGTPLVGCGRPAPGHRIVIASPDTQAELAAGRIGEIWISGPSVTTGYWERADDKALFAAAPDGSAERFLRTGDLGVVWDGELYVVGRLKDLIIIDGRNHHPEDIEVTVERAHPALRPGGCAAFSVEADGRERLVVVAEQDRKAVATRDTILTALRDAVGRCHELPVHDLILLRVGELPRTTSGKVRRGTCRERYLAGAFEMTVP